MRFFYKLGHILKLFSFFSFLTVNVIILIHFRIYEIQDNKSSNSEYAVREESWSSPSLRLFLEENSSWGQKQFKSICRLFYRLYPVPLKTKSLSIGILGPYQGAWGKDTRSSQNSLATHYILLKGKIIILYMLFYLCVGFHAYTVTLWEIQKEQCRNFMNYCRTYGKIKIKLWIEKGKHQ